MAASEEADKDQGIFGKVTGMVMDYISGTSTPEGDKTPSREEVRRCDEEWDHVTHDEVGQEGSGLDSGKMLQRQLKSQAALVSDLCKENEELKAANNKKMIALQQEVDNTRRKNQALVSENNRLEQILAKIKKESHSDVQVLISEKEMTQEKSSSDAEVKELKEHVKGQSKTIVLLKDEIKSLKENQDEFSSDQDSYGDYVRSVEDERDKFKDDFISAKEEIQTLKRAISELKRERKKLQDELTLSKQEAIHAQEAAGNSRSNCAKCKEYRIKCNTLEKECNDSQLRVVDLEKVVTSLKCQVEGLGQTIQKLEEEKNEVVALAKVEAETIRADFLEERKDRERAQGALEELKKKKGGWTLVYQEEIAHLNKQVEALKKEHSTMKTERARAEASVKSSREVIGHLKTQIEELAGQRDEERKKGSKLSQMTKEHEKLKLQFKDATENVVRLIDELDKSKKEKKELQKVSKKAEEKIKKLEKATRKQSSAQDGTIKISEAERLYGEERDRNESLEFEIEDMKEEIEHLKTMNNELKKKHREIVETQSPVVDTERVLKASEYKSTGSKGDSNITTDSEGAHRRSARHNMGTSSSQQGPCDAGTGNFHKQTDSDFNRQFSNVQGPPTTGPSITTTLPQLVSPLPENCLNDGRSQSSNQEVRRQGLGSEPCESSLDHNAGERAKPPLRAGQSMDSTQPVRAVGVDPKMPVHASEKTDTSTNLKQEQPLRASGTDLSYAMPSGKPLRASGADPMPLEKPLRASGERGTDQSMNPTQQEQHLPASGTGPSYSNPVQPEMPVLAAGVMGTGLSRGRGEVIPKARPPHIDTDSELARKGLHHHQGNSDCVNVGARSLPAQEGGSANIPSAQTGYGYSQRRPDAFSQPLPDHMTAAASETSKTSAELATQTSVCGKEDMSTQTSINRAILPQQSANDSVISADAAEDENLLVDGIDKQINKMAGDVIDEVTKGERIMTMEHKPFDPNLVCPMCGKKHRIGEIQKFRRHVDQCDGTKK